MILLFGCSVVGFGLIASDVDKNKANVQIDETVYYGESSFAEGLKINCRNSLERHLFWNTEYTFGEKPSSVSEFMFSQEELYERFSQEDYGVRMEAASEYLGYNEEEENPTGIALAFKELLDQTQPGQSNSKEIYLADYYEYYPIRLSVLLNNFDYMWEEYAGGVKNEADNFTQAFIDFFKIPVLKEEKLQIDLTKDGEGWMVTSGFGSAEEASDGFYLYTESVLGENACYFSFNTYTYNGNTVDTSLIPGGYGIYALPYGSGEEAFNPFDAKGLKLVFPMDEKVMLNELFINSAKTKLYLFTVEEEKLILTTIDVATMNTTERLVLIDSFDSQNAVQINFEEDFFSVFYFGSASYGDFDEANTLLIVGSVDKSGDCEVCFSCPIYSAESGLTDDAYFYLKRTPQLDFDGEKFAVSNFVEDGSENYCSFYLLIYESDGLKFYGEYKSSLDTGSNPDKYYYHCFPFGENPITLYRE